MFSPGRLAQQGQQASRTENDHGHQQAAQYQLMARRDHVLEYQLIDQIDGQGADHRSEEHTSELQSLMRISYDVFCLKKKKKNKNKNRSINEQNTYHIILY